MIRILQAIAVTLTVLIFGVLYWHVIRPFFNAPPNLPPAVQLAETQRYYLELLVADDGKTRLQQMFMAHATLNMSDGTGLTIQEIHKRKLTLAVPSQDGSMMPRDPDAEKMLQDWLPFYGDPANMAQAKLEVARVLKGRRQDYDRYPCLSTVTRYIRPPKWGTYQSREKMDAEMELLYDDGQGARFYGPKGSTNKCR